MADTIFDADELAADAATEATAPAETEQQQADRARDEQGRFAPKPDGPAPAAEAAQSEDQDRTRQVPQGALHAEREKRKDAESKWKAAQAQLDSLAQMRQQITSRQPQTLAVPVAPADPAADDPANELAYLKQRLGQIEGTQQGMVQREELGRVEQAEQQHLGSVLTASEAEFRQGRPDYDAAIEHVITARAQELALYGLSPVQVQQALRDEVLDITRAAIQQGRSPAEVGYQLATLRGYRPQADGQQSAQQPSAAQRQVAAVGQARAASRSLGQASGAGVTRDLNAQTIAAMPIDEFEALYSTPEGRRMIDAL